MHDRGKEFVNKTVRDLNKTFGVEIRVIAPACPESNGQVEVNIRTFKEKMKALFSAKGNSFFFENYFFKDVK